MILGLAVKAVLRHKAAVGRAFVMMLKGTASND